MANFYIVPTPIGNLEDITLRTLKILAKIKIILCEDTRVTQRLLHYLDSLDKDSLKNIIYKKISDGSFIKSNADELLSFKNKELISYHEHNEKQRIAEILKLLDEGNDIALVSDAGTPLISDPGNKIVQAISEHNQKISNSHTIIPLPGASALSTSLSACPFEYESFTFHGFLPSSGQHRRRVLKKIKEEFTTNANNKKQILIFYESPHRIIKTLEDFEKIFEKANFAIKIFLARELTKKFEEFYFDSIQEIIQKLEKQFKSEIQGEFVLISEVQKF